MRNKKNIHNNTLKKTLIIFLKSEIKLFKKSK